MGQENGARKLDGLDLLVIPGRTIIAPDVAGGDASASAASDAVGEKTGVDSSLQVAGGSNRYPTSFHVFDM